jgi:hypothetical protein
VAQVAHFRHRSVSVLFAENETPPTRVAVDGVR